MQAREHSEDLLGLLGSDPNAVVAHAEAPALGNLRGPDADAWLPVVDELDAVRDKVLEQLAQRRRVAVDRGQIVDLDLGPRVIDRSLQSCERLADHGVHVDELEWLI